MPTPMLDLAPFLEAHTCAPWSPAPVQVWHLYDTLTQWGWKVDTEESNLMVGLSRTWPEHGVKVWLRLARFVCAPPDGDIESLESLRFYRFDPLVLPTETMEEKMYAPGDEDEPWYPGHREEWDWLVENGDPCSDDAAWTVPIPLQEVPAEIRAELAEALAAAILPAP